MVKRSIGRICRVSLVALLAGILSYWCLVPRAYADDDAYRVELLMFKRKVDPDSLKEKMASKPVPTLPSNGLNLWVDTGNGQHQSDLPLIDPSQLSLYHASQRMENSGRYKVLMLAGWIDRFPPGYQSKPLIIKMGDPVNGYYPTQGYITINRMRYLHVTANITSLRFVQPQLEPVQPGATSAPTPSTTADDEMPLLGPEDQASGQNDQRVPQVITWLRETRRMRSMELHYLDSPTVGLLVYFVPVKASDLPQPLPPTSVTSGPAASATSAPSASPTSAATPSDSAVVTSAPTPTEPTTQETSSSAPSSNQ